MLFKRKRCKQCGWELGLLTKQNFCSEQCVSVWDRNEREREQYEAKKNIKTVWTKYRVEFGTSGDLAGAYIGDTIEELHEAIDNDKRLGKYEKTHDFVSILKYGYFGEFEDKPYETKDYVIDNCMHFMWTVR